MADLAASMNGVAGTGKHVLLCTAQLAGHIVPLVAIGHALAEKGNNVYLITAKVSDRMPGRLLNGTGVTFFQAGEAPEDEAQVAKYLSEKLGPKVNTYVKMVRGRTHLMTLDAFILKHLIDTGKLHDGGLTFTDDNGRSISFKPDLVIGDHYSSMFTGEHIADKFDIPLLYNSPTVLWDQSPPFPFPVHTFPRGMKEMTFIDRVHSEIWRGVGGYGWVKYLAYRNACAAVGKKYNLKLRPNPGILRMRFTNTCVPFDYPMSTPPLIVYTGALIYPPPETDPEGSTALESWPELRDWLSNKARYSVIVISMGSAARLSVDQGRAFINGIQALGLPALWALREDNREFLPEDFGENGNDMIRLERWIPQKAVLSHPATGAFVGHCGMGGTHEALYFGVPMLGLPVFIDQPELAARLRDTGAGLSLDLSKITAESIAEALRKLIGDRLNATLVKDDNGEVSLSTYAIEARKLSRCLRLQGGVSKVVDICEMAMETGTDMFILPSYTLPYWKRTKMDVVGFFIIVVLVIFLIISAIVGHSRPQQRNLQYLVDSIAKI